MEPSPPDKSVNTPFYRMGKMANTSVLFMKSLEITNDSAGVHALAFVVCLLVLFLLFELCKSSFDS